jgi:hypothetical protein
MTISASVKLINSYVQVISLHICIPHINTAIPIGCIKISDIFFHAASLHKTKQENKEIEYGTCCVLCC